MNILKTTFVEWLEGYWTKDQFEALEAYCKQHHLTGPEAIKRLALEGLAIDAMCPEIAEELKAPTQWEHTCAVENGTTIFNVRLPITQPECRRCWAQSGLVHKISEESI